MQPVQTTRFFNCDSREIAISIAAVISVALVIIGILAQYSVINIANKPMIYASLGVGSLTTLGTIFALLFYRKQVVVNLEVPDDEQFLKELVSKQAQPIDKLQNVFRNVLLDFLNLKDLLSVALVCKSVRTVANIHLIKIGKLIQQDRYIADEFIAIARYIKDQKCRENFIRPKYGDIDKVPEKDKKSLMRGQEIRGYELVQTLSTLRLKVKKGSSIYIITMGIAEKPGVGTRFAGCIPVKGKLPEGLPSCGEFKPYELASIINGTSKYGRLVEEAS